MKKKIKNSGFSLVEFILVIAVGSFIAGVTAKILNTQVDAYSFITNRQSALSDARYANNFIYNELLRMSSDGFTNCSDNSITFIDGENNSVTFQTEVVDGTTRLMRNNDILLNSISSFSLDYFDTAGNQFDNTLFNDLVNEMSNIRQVKMTIVTSPSGNESPMTLTTTVTPRVFIYDDYN